MKHDIDDLTIHCENKINREDYLINKLLYRIALATLKDIKAGCVMIPSEPTDDMVDKFNDIVDIHAESTGDAPEDYEFVMTKDSYAMKHAIKASPKSHIAELMEQANEK